MVQSDHGDGIVTLTDGIPSEAAETAELVDMTLPTGKIGPGQIKEMLLREIDTDPLYIRCAQLYLQDKIFNESFLENLNPYKTYSIKEISSYLDVPITTVYGWAKELSGFIDFKEVFDEKKFSYIGCFQLKMFWALRNAGESVATIITFMKAAKGIIAEDPINNAEVEKLRDRVKMLEKGLHSLVTFMAIADDQSIQALLAAPEQAKELAEQSKLMKEKERTDILKEVERLNAKTADLEEAIQAKEEAARLAELEAQEKYETLIETERQKFTAQLEQMHGSFSEEMDEKIKAYQQKPFFQRLFGSKK